MTVIVVINKKTGRNVKDAITGKTRAFKTIEDAERCAASMNVFAATSNKNTRYEAYKLCD